MCLGGASKQNALFSENMPQKNIPMIQNRPWYMVYILIYKWQCLFKNAKAFSADIYLLKISNQTQEQDEKSFKSQHQEKKSI